MEKEKQKNKPGSITEKQIEFIKTKDATAIQKIIQKINPKCIWNLEKLSTVEAKRIIQEIIYERL